MSPDGAIFAFVFYLDRSTGMSHSALICSPVKATQGMFLKYLALVAGELGLHL